MASKKQSAFNLNAAVAALPDGARLTDPSIPPDVLLQEARQCAAAAKKQRARFLSLPGFSISHVDQLPGLIAAFETAQRAWDRKRAEKQSGRNRKLTRLEAEKLRQDFLATGRFLFRRDAAALTEMERITEGEGLADLIQDLRDLVKFHSENVRTFALDKTLPRDAARRAGAHADALSETVDSEDAIAAREYRNQVGVLLDASLAEIRECARYLHRKDAARLAPYLSRYLANKQARSRRKTRRLADASG